MVLLKTSEEKQTIYRQLRAAGHVLVRCRVVFDVRLIGENAPVDEIFQLNFKEQTMCFLVGGLEHVLCFIIFHILGMSSSQVTKSYFSEGWLNHQAVLVNADMAGNFRAKSTLKDSPDLGGVAGTSQTGILHFCV